MRKNFNMLNRKARLGVERQFVSVRMLTVTSSLRWVMLWSMILHVSPPAEHKELVSSGEKSIGFLMISELLKLKETKTYLEECNLF
jgi:hypothetical protein